MSNQRTGNRPTIRTSQSGMASILITMITMIVVSLIVLGFATISRREQGQTLNQQLSTQAFYAAESGVEDARNVISSAIKDGKAVPGKTNCTNNTDDAGYSPNYPVGAGTVLDGGHDVSYTCLLVNPNPTSLVYNGLGDNSVVVPMAASDVIDQIKITWTPTATPSGTPASCPSSLTSSFSPSTKWSCGYGLFRMDLVPTDGPLDHATLQSSQLTAFFEPLNVGSSGNLSYSGNKGKANVVAANCTTGSYQQCTATITGMASSKSFTLRINSMYQPSNVTVVGYHGGTPISVTGAQAIVDVTGRANGVLRRIQVRLPVNEYSGNIPDFGLQSNAAICKRFLVTPGYLSIPNDIKDPDTSNQMCVSQSYGTPGSGG